MRFFFCFRFIAAIATTSDDDNREQLLQEEQERDSHGVICEERWGMNIDRGILVAELINLHGPLLEQSCSYELTVLLTFLLVETSFKKKKKRNRKGESRD